jgi:hypothetical protein
VRTTSAFISDLRQEEAALCLASEAAAYIDSEAEPASEHHDDIPIEVVGDASHVNLV